MSYISNILYISNPAVVHLLCNALLLVTSCVISPAEVRTLWAQLRRDEPHLLSNFEDFLARVTSQIIVANQEKREMESALKRSEDILFLYIL